MKFVGRFFLFLAAVCSVSLLANPQSHCAVSGDVQIAEAGPLLEVQASNRAIVNWESFSIQVGEITRFIQPSELSAVLNRVTGSEISQIMGQLHSNGKVYLMNPNGIVIGKEGRIDTAAFVATCLDIKNLEFLNDETLKLEGEGIGKIINLGVIETSSGSLTLIAHKIENSGKLVSHRGTTSLLSGHEVLIDKTGEGLLFIRPDLQAEGIENDGEIEALKVKLESDVSPDSLAIGLGGIIEAKAIEHRGGEIYLVARSGSIEVEPTGRLTASPNGLIKVHAEKERVVMNGEIQTPFGRVHVLGGRISLGEESLIDVSSDFGGGTVLIGGDFQGKNPEITNAEITWVKRGARIKADALVQGDGGKIICWADNRTAFHGELSARGGSFSGDGGFAEVSGKNWLNFDEIRPDMRAPFGKTGQILFDPSDITISTGSQSPAWTNPFNPGPGEPSPSIANTTEVQNALALADVTISTSNGNQGLGILTVANDVTWATTNKLTLTTTRNIIISPGVTISNTNLGGTNFDAMEFTATGAVAASYSGILVQGAITSGYGNITLTGTGGNGSSNHGIQITTGGSITSTQAALAESARITLNGTGGTASSEVGVDITVADAITAADGAISVIGQGGGNATASLSRGVQLVASGTAISTTGIGTITINGTGASGTGGSNEGVFIQAGVSAFNGDISITGVGGSGAAANVHGISLGSGDTVSSGSGNITFHGTGGANATSGGNGIDLTSVGSGSINSTSTGAITLTGIDQEGSYNGILVSGISIGGVNAEDITLNTDTISLSGNLSGTENLIIQPITASQDINLGSGSGGLDLSTSELDQIQDGFSSVTIGKSDGSGTLTLGSSYTFNDPVILRAGPMTLNVGLAAGSNSITLTSNNGAVNLNSVNANTGALTINIGQVSSGSLSIGSVVTGTPVTINGSAQDNTYSFSAPDNSSMTINEVSGTNTYNLASFGSLPLTVNVGSGTDILVFSDAANITAVSLANGGTNEFDYGDYTSAISVNLQGSTATGITTVTSISELDLLQGSSTANGTLTGLNSTNNWAVGGTNSGTYVSGGNTLTFSNIGSLVTGTGTDTISFSDAQSITGTVSFTAGTANAINYSAYTTAVSVDLQAGTATGTAGISNSANITSIVGSGLTGSSGDSLTGPSGTATWTMDNSTNDKGSLTYGASTTAYEGISNFTGGTGTDTFVIKQGSVTTGVIDGGDGGDILDYSNFTTTAVTVDFTGKKATNIFTTGVGSVGADNGILNFHEVGVGSNGTVTGGSNTIIAGHDGQTNTWTVDGAKAGNVVNSLGTTSFSSTGTLTLNGGSSTDNFTVASTGTVDVINGGGGTNSLTYLLVQDNTWNITDNNAGNINGGVTFTGLQSLTGGPQNDTFVLSDEKGLTGTADGGSIAPNTNTLDYSNYTTAIEYNLTAGTATNMGAITRIQSVTEPTLTNTPIPPVIQQEVATVVAKQTTESDLEESEKVIEGTLESKAVPSPKAPCRSPSVSVQAF